MPGVCLGPFVENRMQPTPLSESFVDVPSILRSFPGMHIYLSPDFTILEASDDYLAATFTTRDFLLGKNLFEAFPANHQTGQSESREAIQQSLQDTVTHKQPHTFTQVQRYDLKNPQGEYQEKYWQLKTQPVLDAAQNVQYLIHSVVDVTASHQPTQTQKQLTQEQLKRFELLANATNDVIWDWDFRSNYIWWNEGYKTTFGYTDEEIDHEATSWTNRIHPDDLERVVKSIREVVDSGGTHWQDEYRFQKADGTYADILDRGVVAHDDQGKPIRMIGAMLDQTEKKRHTTELQASEKHVRALLESIPEIAWVARADGDINYFNKAWYAYTGNANPDESWEQAAHPDDLVANNNHWASVLATGQEYNNQIRLKRAADGQYRWFSVRATPMQDAQGNIQAWIGVNTDIQEQKNIQQKLRERDEYVQRMLSQAPVQFAVLKGPKLVGDFATPQFRLLVGGRDIVGKPFREALPELKHQGYFEIIENVYASGILYRGTEQPASLDRKGTGELEVGYFDFTYQPLFGLDHQVEGIMILVVEVTEKVLAQQQTVKLTKELKASHDRVTQILDALPQMSFTSLPDGYVDFYSQQWYDYLGTTPEILNGWGWEKFIHPEDLEKTTVNWLNSINTGQTFEIENRWLKKETDQEYRWFLVRGVPVKDAQGNISMWVGSHTDIHEQKQTQLALQESTKNFQFLADSMPQLVWTTDAEGYHDYFNKKWVEYTGYDEELSKGGRMWNNLLHPDDQARAAQRWADSLATGNPYQIEYRFKRASDGEWRWFLARALPMRDQEGTIVKWFGTCTDIEEQKRDEEMMVLANIELRTINEDLDSFVYTASHDLKLPIINMAGIFKELVRNATFKDPDAEMLIGMFDKSLNRINATISDLAEIVKVQKNINAQRVEVNLQDLVEEVNLSIQDMIMASGAEIQTDFTEIPILRYSHVNLKSIFYNLISNAIKYRAAGIKPIISLKTALHGEYIQLEVKDNGMGIDMNKHGGKIFQMFKRFHNHVPGSGLGLYIINRIMQKNGGYIEVKSQVNEGTTFNLYFKAAGALPEDVAPETSNQLHRSV